MLRRADGPARSKKPGCCIALPPGNWAALMGNRLFRLPSPRSRPFSSRVKRSTHCEQFVNVRCAPCDRNCRARGSNEQRSNRWAGSLNPVLSCDCLSQRASIPDLRCQGVPHRTEVHKRILSVAIVDMGTVASLARSSGIRGSLASIRAGVSQSQNLMTGTHCIAREHRNKLVSDEALLILGIKGP
jgi:hypothetical protein